MPKPTPPRKFANFNNIDWLNAFRKTATPEYQARVPWLTQANYEQTMRELDNYIPGQNAILAALINKVGLTKFNADHFDNPMAEFIQPPLAFGESVEDVQLGFIQATSYDTDRTTGERYIFSREDIEMDSTYYQTNRQERYKVTLDNMGGEIRKAFHNAESGLNDFLNAAMAALQTSANYDEFVQMCHLISDYEEKGGFFKVNVPDLKTGTREQRKAAAEILLEELRAYSAEMLYPNRLLNASGLPTFSKADEQIILTTPAGKAALDVQALATLFNLDVANVPARVIMIPQDKWKIPGAQAILTTRRFFQVFPVLTTMTEQQNPAELYSNHWLHIHQIIAYSRYVPAVLFWTGAATETDEVVWTVTGLGAATFKDLEGTTVTTLARGDAFEIQSLATGTGEGLITEVGYALHSPGASVRTRVGTSGVILVSRGEELTSLTIERWAVADPSIRDTVTVKLTGEIVDAWPLEVKPEPVEPDPEP